MAGDEDDVRVNLELSGGDGADPRFEDRFDVDPCEYGVDSPGRPPHTPAPTPPRRKSDEMGNISPAKSKPR